MKRDDYDIIRRPIVTEKAIRAEGFNTYVFEVDVKANKHQIKSAIENIFDVNVVAVRTMRRHGKPRRTRFKVGKTKDWKKAVVRLAGNQTIDVI